MLTSKCLEEFQSRGAELRLENLSPVVDCLVGGEERRGGGKLRRRTRGFGYF